MSAAPDERQGRLQPATTHDDHVLPSGDYARKNIADAIVSHHDRQPSWNVATGWTHNDTQFADANYDTKVKNSLLIDLSSYGFRPTKFFVFMMSHHHVTAGAVSAPHIGGKEARVSEWGLVTGKILSVIYRQQNYKYAVFDINSTYIVTIF